jgi:transcriptional regulator with XRE-family HTH domain
LLAPDAIKDLRERCGLTQPAFESFLCAGRKTVARWELGVVAPHRTVDLLLRVLIESAEARRVCSRLTGVKIAERRADPIGRAGRVVAGVGRSATGLRRR